jgi:tetratricopeptide (TPR) repeat protein
MRQLRILLLLAVLPLLASHAYSQEPTQKEAQELLRQASRLIPDISEMQQMSVAANVANAQARVGDMTGALSTVLLLKKPEAQAQALGSVAYFVDYSGDTDGALKLLARAAKGQITDGSYEQIAWAHARKGDFSSALRVAHRIQGDPSRSVDALTGIAKAQWKSGEHAGAESTWDEAIQVATRSTNDHMDPAILLISVATSRAEVGETAAASAALNDVYRTIADRDTPDQGLHSILASAFAQIGEVTSALDIIKGLPSGSNRDICLMGVSSQLAKKNDIADAEEVASRISDPQLKTNAFQSMAEAEAESGRPRSAIDAAEKIPNLSGRADALAHLALEQAEKGDGVASSTLQLALDAANRSRITTPEYVFAIIAVTHAVLGEFDLAKEITWGLTAENRAWPWWNITAMMVNSGDLSGALKIAAKETDTHPKAYALLGTANGVLDSLPKKAGEAKSHPVN